jgi:hypothetical protein
MTDAQIFGLVLIGAAALAFLVILALIVVASFSRINDCPEEIEAAEPIGDVVDIRAFYQKWEDKL